MGSLLARAPAAEPRSDLILFLDNDGRQEILSGSWGRLRPPSHVELGMEDKATGKFPVEKGISYRGRHALRLKWTSAPGGGWTLCVATPGWSAQDLTGFSNLMFHVNSPEAIDGASLPWLAVEDVNNAKTRRLALSNFIAGVDADPATWQPVAVPLSVIVQSAGTADLSRVKSVHFQQGRADGVEHVLWLDDLRFTADGVARPPVPAAPAGLSAKGYDSRVDLRWERSPDTNTIGYYVYGANSADGPFEPVSDVLQEPNLYSDFFGRNNEARHYYVTAANSDLRESAPSETVCATSRWMSSEELLTSVQESAFRYFYDYGHPSSGLARERKGSGDIVTTGGSGFGLVTIMVGADRGFITREAAVERLLKILKFLNHKVVRYHGAFPHWFNGRTGETIAFSEFDDGADLVETAFLVQGLLTIRQYFDGENESERELRRLATKLWEEVEWDWFRRKPSDTTLTWHWSPRHGWKNYHPILGFNECLMVYVLAVASPTHGVPPSMYEEGWASGNHFINGNSYYGHKQWVGWPHGGPLFFTHYSFIGLDPRSWRDRYCNYFANNRNISLIHRAYCIENPKKHKGYGPTVWGMTASDNPWGYNVHEPTAERDNGTISPTAVVCAMPYTPEESMAAIRHFYYALGKRLWSEFGFRDAFNLNVDWFADSVIAIDQGPMAPMIENHRTGLCWKHFMANPEIPESLEAMGWFREGDR